MPEALAPLLSEKALWLGITFAIYCVTVVIYKRSHGKPFLLPIFTTILVIIGILKWTGIEYKVYFEGSYFLHFLLGPATVALALPLYEQRERLAKMWLPLTCGLFAGGTIVIVSSVLIAHYFGATLGTVITLAPKSVTAPIAMGICEKTGGIVALCGPLVVATGVIGSMLAPPIIKLLREKDDAVAGFAIGLTAHGGGTAVAFQISRETGAFSGLAMGLNGIFTAFAIPLILPWLLSAIGY